MNLVGELKQHRVFPDEGVSPDRIKRDGSLTVAIRVTKFYTEGRITDKNLAEAEAAYTLMLSTAKAAYQRRKAIIDRYQKERLRDFLKK